MAYVEYDNLTSPDDVLSAIATYVTSKGYPITKALADDLDIYDSSSTDGKKLCFQMGDYFVVMRSANGTNIFGAKNNDVQDIAPRDTNSAYYGIGMTVAEGYSNSVRWYNQYHAPVGKTSGDILGVYMPVPTTVDSQSVTYTLYCNEILLPTKTLVFSLMKNGDNYKQVTHLSVGLVNKYDTWTGGAIFSGSFSRYDMVNAPYIYKHVADADKYVRPLFSSGNSYSNAFLRIDIDEAPDDSRGNIYWASSGKNNETGKPMALPIRTTLDSNGEIPHYYYLRSRSRTDSGMNVNTLNCISVNMPLFVAVQVDPDVLKNYAAVGTISGVFFISTFNTQTGLTYEMSYPGSGDLCQTFPIGLRRGQTFGFDGISIKQEQEESD